MRPRRRWLTRLVLLFFTALIALAVDMGVLSYDAARSSRLLLVGAAVLTGIGILGFALTIVFTRRSGMLYRRRGEIVLACVSALVTLLVILAGSVAIRILPTYPVAYERWDSEIGHVPGQDDKVGGRFETIDPAREHVLIVGDSVAAGWALADDEVVGRQLESLVEPYQVINLSTTGWSIDQYYLYLKRILPKTRPKLVIVAVFAGNDFEVTGRIYGWGHTKPLYRMQGDELVRVNPDVLAPNCFDHLAQSLLFRPIWSDRVLAMDAAEFFCHPLHLSAAETERVVARLFDLIEEESNRSGAQVLFTLLPVRYWLKHLMTSDCIRYKQRYDRLLRILEDGHHKHYEFVIDLLRADPAEEMFLEDQAHLQAAGHRLLAEGLAREIKSRGLLH